MTTSIDSSEAAATIPHINGNRICRIFELTRSQENFHIGWFMGRWVPETPRWLAGTKSPADNREDEPQISSQGARREWITVTRLPFPVGQAGEV
jgi:hypothetical protein